jgi:hypothetical protein
MKKSTLALSIAAAIGSLGMAGAANAAMEVNAGGIGHQLVFPYFSAQGDNATLLSITNTDTVNGKLVKVRFRGAANSDDLYDFQVLLSPGDIWTAAVSKDATTGLAQLATSDKSCTLPASVNSTFNTNRLDPSATADAKANGTREGYVEVINMGDIPPLASTLSADVAATRLFKTVKHVAGVAPCAAAVLQEKLGEKLGTKTADSLGELTAPTGGLTGDWILLNQVNTAAWSGSATALKATAATQVVFWPQKDGAVDITAGTQTADPLLTKGVVTAQNFDLPDMSTVYTTGAGAATTAADHADAVTAALAVKSVSNQFVTSDDIAAVTDMLFSQPTRRYHVAVNYTGIKDDAVIAGAGTADLPTAKTGTDAIAVYRDATPGTVNATAGSTGGTFVTGGTANKYYNTTNMAFPTGSRTLCLKSITTPGQNERFDREELTPASSTTDFTISPRPATAATTVFVCGEAAVMSINNGGSATDSALSASVARNDVTFPAGYENGWLRFNTAAAANASGLPILGASFIRMANGAVNYGTSYAHKVTK